MSNSSDSTNQADDWLKIKRELQLLKAEDGEYVLRSLGSVYALPALIDYIAQAQQQLLRELVEQSLQYENPSTDYPVSKYVKAVPLEILNKKLQAYGGESNE